MKERPILFSSPMVRAILAGRKTQTRRIVKPAPPEWCGEAHHRGEADWYLTESPIPFNAFDAKCPYGQPGDRLWVRETFYCDMLPFADGGPLPKDKPDWADDNLYYRADGTCCQIIPECSCAEVGKPKFRPSIHMPRWASRITLEVVSVRVERLSEITEADAIAEGIVHDHLWDRANSPSDRLTYVGCGETFATAVEAYQHLWGSINGPGSWEANPWVWVVEFKRVETQTA